MRLASAIITSVMAVCANARAQSTPPVCSPSCSLGQIFCVSFPGPGSTVVPKYYILSVIYAPPGTKGGGSLSSVTYDQGSTMGTTTSASKSFNQSYSVSASLGIVAKDVVATTIAGAFTYAQGSTNSESLEITKEERTIYTAHGSDRQDGVDHDLDSFLVWIRPQVVTWTQDCHAFWKFKEEQEKLIVRVYVGELRNPDIMDAGVRGKLDKALITPADYPGILFNDHFYWGEKDPTLPTSSLGNFLDAFKPFSDIALVDTSRFLRTEFAPSYRHGFAGSAFTSTYSITNGNIKTQSQSTTSSSKVDLSISHDINTSLLKLTLKNENSWEWTNTATFDSKNGNSQASTVVIEDPSSTYDGKVHGANVAIYYDQIYKTFAFRLE